MVTLYFDGCCEPVNPGGWMGIGAIISDGNTDLCRLSESIGRGTNNIAEYTALERALQWAADNGLKIDRVFGDSQLVINQVGGGWRINQPHLLELANRCRSLLAKTGNPPLHWVRSENNLADPLSRLSVQSLVRAEEVRGRIMSVGRTRKPYVCRDCGTAIPSGSACYVQEVHYEEACYPLRVRLCTSCGGIQIGHHAGVEARE